MDLSDLAPYDEEDDGPSALGLVVEQDRGSLPFALVHGEALVACAAWSLGDAGVVPVDVGTTWADLAEAGGPVVLHDALCPMTPAEFLAECLRTAVATDEVVVGVRPVTDTVRRTQDGFLGETLDRSGLLTVASPVVLPAAVVAALEGLPSSDFAELVASLRERFTVRVLEAPAAARRVADADDVRLLEAMTTPVR